MRMEDLDPPREEPGAQAAILKALESYGFEWDGEMVRQSDRHDALRRSTQSPVQSGPGPTLAPARANNWSPTTASIRGCAAMPGTAPKMRRFEFAYLNWTTTSLTRVQGEFHQHLGRDVGDFVIRRRDGLYAYQLAVVLDDAWQGITDIVRGADLLDSTPAPALSAGVARPAATALPAHPADHPARWQQTGQILSLATAHRRPGHAVAAAVPCAHSGRTPATNWLTPRHGKC